ncbi:Hsp20/alpha crystallin family protein [Parvularcula lutaonensis]|uniref:Hsp20/alpha crystallin family protein n=1 Tax=Parvularcula lutaonensis TaxID=491923 RepID=A0ABV7MAR1_9PROT|nr:Hsp20/alpha crystallin family protein [Parvularcula lutaonensis]GGY38427.1 molecular chaperone Hsp20 [Parvularcula lutaonensis]
MKVRDLVPWGRRKNADHAPALRFRGGRDHRQDRERPLDLFQDEMNDVFERFFRRFDAPSFDRFGGLFGGVPQPLVDVSETDKEIKIVVDLPGLDEDDIDVSVTGNLLTVRGERREERDEDERGFVVHERTIGTFYRSIPLPPGIDPDKAKAEFKRGVLKVRIPKTADAAGHTKRIEVKAA